MSLMEDLIPKLLKLSRAEKLYVLQLLIAELIKEENAITIPPGEYPVWSPYDAYGAANALTSSLSQGGNDDISGRTHSNSANA